MTKHKKRINTSLSKYKKYIHLPPIVFPAKTSSTARSSLGRALTSEQKEDYEMSPKEKMNGMRKNHRYSSQV